GIRDKLVTGVQTCALPILSLHTFDQWAPCAAERGVEHKDRPRSFDRKSLGAAAVGDHFVQLGAGRGARAGGKRNSENSGGYAAKIGRASCRERVEMREVWE